MTTIRRLGRPRKFTDQRQVLARMEAVEADRLRATAEAHGLTIGETITWLLDEAEMMARLRAAMGGG